MLNLQTKTITVNESLEVLKQRLSNPQVLASYLPDQVTNIQSNDKELSFNIMGGTLLRLKPKIEIDKLLKRLDFYENRNEKVYHLVVMTTYLELEEECIKIYTNQVTALNSLKHRDRNKVKVNQEYKMVLRSEVFDPEINHLEYDSVRFFIDGMETKMDYNLRVIGGIGILKFIPNQVGIYSIKGKRYLVSNSNPRKRKLRSYFYQKNVQK